ncbi:hypothetical protein ACWDOP_06855 [Nocardia sp. NPDC003693]
MGDGGILYVEPWYLERNSAGSNAPSFPQLVKVLASYQDKVGMGATVKEALDKVLPGSGSAATDQPGQVVVPPNQGTTPPNNNGGTAPAPGKEAAIKQIDDALATVGNAQRSGDLGELGKALENLQRAVDAYEKAGS